MLSSEEVVLDLKMREIVSLLKPMHLKAKRRSVEKQGAKETFSFSALEETKGVCLTESGLLPRLGLARNRRNLSPPLHVARAKGYI